MYTATTTATTTTAAATRQACKATNSIRLGLPTPQFLAPTRAGLLTHLTPDIACKTISSTLIGHVPVEQLLGGTRGGNEPATLRHASRLSSFAGMPESKLLYFADLFDNTANISRISKTTDDHVIATTYSGGKPVTPQLYMSAIQAIKPATFAALVDLIYPAARTGPLSTLVPSARRLSKSLQRSIKWLDECIELNETSAQRPPLLFAHLGGGSSVELRHKWAELVKQRDEAVSGIIISDNALSPNDSKMNLDVYEASLEPFASNERITKMAYGFGRPDHSLLMISRFGVDMIDASAYIHDATNRGRAFTFTFGSLDGNSTSSPTLHLFNREEHAASLSAISSNCACPVCTGSLGPSNGNAKQPFTRAYIHHLLATHEMLAQVLLMSHNVHHMDRFYADIRASIARGTFTSDMNSFLARYNFEADETQVDKGEQITMAAVQQSVASARISSSS